MMHRFLALLLALCATGALAAPNILQPIQDVNTQPGIISALTATVGSSPINTTIFVDLDKSGLGSPGEAGNTTNSYYQNPTNNYPENHAPYSVIAWPFPANPTFDVNYYATMVATPSVIASGGPAIGQTGPGSNYDQLPASQMSATSPNSTDGNKGTCGWGSEFEFSTSYLGLNTTTDSYDSGTLSALVAAVRYNNSGLTNLFDIHAIFRITASNWSAGYAHGTCGYGTVSYSAANTYASTIYLQPPDMQVQNNGWYARISLYPFRQTRRAYEVVYSVPSSYSWPRGCTGHGTNGCEYTSADLTAAGGTCLYVSSASGASACPSGIVGNGTDTVFSFSYSPAVSSTVTFVAFTADGSGNYSREEEFSPVTTTYLIGGACLQ